MARNNGTTAGFLRGPLGRGLGVFALVLSICMGAGMHTASAQTVSITDGQASYTPGQWVVYTVTVANNTGASIAANNRRLRVPAVAGLSISDIGCFASGATCPAIDITTQSAQITLLETTTTGLPLPAMPIGSSMTFLIAGAFHANATGAIGKTAAVTNATGATVINSATDSSSAINLPVFTSCPAGAQYVTWTGSGTTHTGSMTPAAGFIGMPNVTSTIANSSGVTIGAAESLTATGGTDSAWPNLFGASPAGNVRLQTGLNVSPGGFDTPAVQTLDFASVVAANSWGFLLADNDVEQIRIEAFSGPNLTGTAYSPAQVNSWYRGVYDQDGLGGRDLPRWLPGVAGSMGADLVTATNNAVPPGTLFTTDQLVTLDSSRAAMWFTPGAPVQSLRITYQNLGNTATTRLYVASCLQARPQLRLQKSLPNGRAVTSDQFTLRIGDGASILQTATTTGTTNAPTQVATLTSATAGTTYTLSEIGAGTPAAALSNYTTTYTCTNALAGGQTPSGTGTSFDVTPVIGDDLTCTFANTRKQATLTVTKISQGGARAFTFTGNNGWTSQTLTTTMAGVGVTGVTQTLTSLDTATTITETMPPGFVLSGVTCTGMGPGGAVTTGTSSFTLDAAAVAADSNIACTVTNSVQSQPAFPTCPSNMYLSQSPNANTNTTLYDVDTSTSPITYPAIAQGSNVYNAIGFNPVDNYIYGMNYAGGIGNRLVRVGADGSTVDLGPVAGMTNSSWISATFSDTGVMYVLIEGSTTTLRAIDVQTNTSTSIPLLASVDAADIAWKDGLIYTVQSTGQLRSINPATGAVTNIGLPSGAATYGAMFGSPTGLFGSSNTGGFYSFDVVTGTRTLISGSPGATVNDGASCPTAPLRFDADLSVTKTNTPAQGPDDLPNDPYLPGEVRTYRIVVTNLGPFGVQNASVTDPLPPGVNAATASWTCTSTSGGAVCGAASGAGALNDTGLDLPANAVATYLVTLTVPTGVTGAFNNTVTVTPPSNINDTSTGNNTAADVDQAVPLLTLRKISIGGVGSFGFTGSNGVVAQILTTTTAGSPVSGATQALAAAGNAATITESTTPATYQVTDITCTGLGTGGTSTPDLANRTVALDAAATAAGADIECTFTNTLQETDIQVVKTASPDPVVAGNVVAYTLVVSNNGAQPASNILLTDVAGAGQDCTAPSTTATCAASGGASCPSPTVPVSSLLGGGVTIPSLPVGGQVTVTLQCTVSATGMP